MGWVPVRMGGEQLEDQVRSFAVKGVEKWDGGWRGV